jgi:hypothetical protein
MKDQITINGPPGAFGAYIARPARLPAPAVVVLQELFGVNADIRKVRNRRRVPHRAAYPGGPDRPTTRSRVAMSKLTNAASTSRR